MNELDSKDEMDDEEEHGEPAVEAIQEDEGAPDTPSLTEEDINKMTVAQLKEELHKRKQSVNGKKEVLQGWLLGAINAPVVTNDRNKEQQEQVMGFAPKAKWQDLTLNNNPVHEPTRNSNLVGLTIPTGEEEFTKYNFDDIFNRPPITAMSKVVELNVKGKPMKDKHSRV